MSTAYVLLLCFNLKQKSLIPSLEVMKRNREKLELDIGY